jgi:hypothetical protein
VPPILAICEACGAVFPSGFNIEGGSATMVGNKAGPCPRCGEMGLIPDGIYEFAGETLRIISAWDRDRLDRLADALSHASTQPDRRRATEAVLAAEPELRPLAQRLLIPRDAGQFYGFVAVLVAALALMQSCRSDPTIQINPTIIVDTAVSQTTSSMDRPR